MEAANELSIKHNPSKASAVCDYDLMEEGAVDSEV